MAKCSKIRHIVRLRQMLRRWRLKAAAAAAADAAAAATAAPSDVPAGHVAVCVRRSFWRFVVRAAHLNHPVFLQLLWQAEEKYGFPSGAGPIALPCDEDLFEDVLCHISLSSSSSALSASLDDLMKSPSSSSMHPCCYCFCCHIGRWHGVGETFPLLGSLSAKAVR